MPRGGARVGAGRKPGRATVIGIVDRRPIGVTLALGPAPADAARSPLAAPPAGMREAEAAVWRVLAPHAISQQTLVESTVHGFHELVEIVALKDTIAAALLDAGAATAEAGALLSHYARLSQRVDVVLQRYRLTAQGRPEPAAQVAPKPASPWAMVAGGVK